MINCDFNKCTACEACISICPKKCITLKKDALGVFYPTVDTNNCINCGLCDKVCHLNNDYLPEIRSEKVYAAYSLDKIFREKSASGGIASTIYRYCLNNNIHTFGVYYTPNHQAEYIEIKTENDILLCCNSKYVFSHIGNTYIRIKEYLKNGEKVLFIGLPCQVAGLISFLQGRHNNLMTVDIICHGTCPEEYLNRHIAAVCKQHTVNKVFFRDPYFGTHNFVLSLYDNNKLLYHKKVRDADVYQIGYHKAVIYRANCYNCKYAKNVRMGDITISDFSGLGRLASYDMPKTSVSCVICSTSKGQNLIKMLENKEMLTLFDRPADEAYLYEKQLNGPSVPHPARSIFIKEYINSRGNFENSAKTALRYVIIKNQMYNVFHVDLLKKIGSKVLPSSLKVLIKRLVHL